MSQPHCLFEREEAVAIVTLNRPERRNALSAEMLVRLWRAWQQIDSDPEIRCAILTGAGKSFCAGADLKSMAAGHRPEPGEAEWRDAIASDPDIPWKALLKQHRLAKPLIAAVEGHAMAGGTEILQGTDVRIAAEDAVFGLAEVRRGLFPLGGSTVRLRRQIPYAHAAEILLTGRDVPAREALAIGLIGRVVPSGTALAEARETARQIARNGPLAVQAVLQSLRETADLAEPEALQREAEIGLPVFASEDALEGSRAFSEKREPRFTGR